MIFLYCPASAEIIIRLANSSPLIGRHHCSPSGAHSQYTFIPDDRAGYALRPYFEGEMINKWKDYRAKVIVNSLGLRDNIIEREIDPGKTSILMLGDSMTFGEGVEYDKSYPAVVERL